MSKYTAEQLHEIIDAIDASTTMAATPHPDCDAGVKLVDIDEWHILRDGVRVLLRERQASTDEDVVLRAIEADPSACAGQFTERESAKSAVTDEMVCRADVAQREFFESTPFTGDSDRLTHESVRAALEAVAPMLASAHVNQEPYCYTVEQKNGLSQGAMCRTKAECEASPLFDSDSDHIIPLYREPMLASTRVPNDTADMLQDAWRDIAKISGSALLAGEKKSQTVEQRGIAYSLACSALAAVGCVYQEITGKSPMLAADPKPETEE